MAFPANTTPQNFQLVIDKNYSINVAMPNQGNTANSNALDLENPLGTSRTAGNLDVVGSAGPFPATRYVLVQIFNSASASTANNKNVNVVIQHANPYAANGLVNTGNFVNIPQFATPILQAVDASGNTPQNTVNIMLPPDVRRFIRVQAVAEANQGNAGNDSNLVLQLLF